MRFETSVAWRQLGHHRGQTLLTVGVVAVSVTLVVFLSTLIGGLQKRILSTVTGSIPHVLVSPPERAPMASWDEAPTGGTVYTGSVVPLEQRRRKIEDWVSVLERIRAVAPAGVRAIAPVVEGQAVASREARRQSVRLLGVDPARYNAIADIEGHLLSGRFIGLNGGEAALGRRLASELGLRLGDRIQLLGAEGGTARLTVAGIYDIGVGQLDLGAVFVPMRDAQSLLGTGNAITTIGLKLDDVFAADAVAAALARQVDLKVESWMQDNQSTLTGLRAQSSSSQMIIAFTTLAAGLAIASLMVMAVASRTREIGILKAMGARPGQILRLFTLHGLVLCTIGAAVGSGVSWLLCRWLGSIVALSDSGRPAQLFPIDLSPRYFLLANALALLAGLLASLYPAWRAARVDPIEVIRGQ